MNDLYNIIFSYLTVGEILNSARLVDHAWDRHVHYYSIHTPSFRFVIRVRVPFLLRDRNRYDHFFRHPMMSSVEKIILEMYEVPARRFKKDDFSLLVYPAVLRRTRRFLHTMLPFPYEIDVELKKDPCHQQFLDSLAYLILLEKEKNDKDKIKNAPLHLKHS